ncbi:Der GTPase-activating protein YihI [Dongshaea marina]|uniref:Der GTPase-activating protein YihI n=1 Tax=Dongshaea marina TaxID=2047966 RepID=UPI000D3E1F07|nr:Der GTPase-activating protein YihI [Dongshaea marina]
MTRKKKGRKPGSAPARRDSGNKAMDLRDSKRKKAPKGLAPGSRANPEKNTEKPLKKGPKDTRLGSKKPIQLKVESKKSPAKPQAKEKPAKVTTAVEMTEQDLEKQLLALENDERLSELLDKLDREEVISAEDQQWLETQLEKHQKLLKQLGMDDELELDDSSDDALWERFNQDDK